MRHSSGLRDKQSHAHGLQCPRRTPNRVNVTVLALCDKKKKVLDVVSRKIVYPLKYLGLAIPFVHGIRVHKDVLRIVGTEVVRGALFSISHGAVIVHRAIGELVENGWSSPGAALARTMLVRT